ncbi:homoserine O-acetyltransferase MetX [Microcystis aeruginosa]|uniref:Homoserine O-acetyltransferase n=1 Tax=Microcystis aeruginosa PCC 9808 TaxID=1160284 RepID=I4HS47_MICAE|nr:homoserine O-acetyltransferase [Microcystis aeruginosa]CCI24871.1 Homoserine O-acetyltransferase [Microcystis aeruginosa PCC 9808]
MDRLDLISPETRFYSPPHPFVLESGAVLERVRIAYRTWGILNNKRDNGVIVCHAFTGWADVEAWWEPLLGTGRVLDPTRDFIVCSNILGSCYGTTGPTSIDPRTGKPYGPTFPEITVRDLVHLQRLLMDALGIESLRLVIGGSLGGMQVLEWALLYPERTRSIAVIAASGRHSAWCIALGEAQRGAIYADPDWQGGNYSLDRPPARGLSAARMMAMTTYRSHASFEERFGREYGEGGEFTIARYLEYQGKKLVERFDANAYITLSRAMDRHDVTRTGKSYESVLQSIQQPTVIVAIDSDLLYPPVEQEELAKYIPNSELFWLRSPHGHDAFLMDGDMDALNDLLVTFGNGWEMGNGRGLGMVG